MNRIVIPLISVLVALLVICYQSSSVRHYRDEYRREAKNVEVLMNDVQRWRTSDSLSAARVQALSLTVEEFRRFRSEDAAAVKELTRKNAELAEVVKAQTRTIIDLRAVPADTVIIRDSVPVPATVVHCGDRWFDFDGILASGEFAGRLAVRDSIICVETVEYRRFLGFLWKTNNIRSRDVTVSSKNPHTEIIGADFITIEK